MSMMELYGAPTILTGSSRWRNQFNPSVVACLLDEPTGSSEHLRRNCHANLLRRFQIDHQLELSWLLHWQIGRLGSFQNPVHEICDASVLLGDVIPVRHEAARMDILVL